MEKLLSRESLDMAETIGGGKKAAERLKLSYLLPITQWQGTWHKELG
jgi:hypothetical protein